MAGSSHLVTRARCPACESPECSELYSCPFSEPPLRDCVGEEHPVYELVRDGTYRLLECARCGLVFQGEVPDEAVLRVLYEDSTLSTEELYEHDMRLVTLDALRTYALEILRVLSFFDREPSQVKVLDFGMGWGTWCRIAASFGCDCHGIELAAEKARVARSHGIATLTEDELAGRQFDFVNAEQVFEHLTQPLQTLRLLAPAVRPGGGLEDQRPERVRPQAAAEGARLVGGEGDARVAERRGAARAPERLHQPVAQDDGGAVRARAALDPAARERSYARRLAEGTGPPDAPRRLRRVRLERAQQHLPVLHARRLRRRRRSQAGTWRR